MRARARSHARLEGCERERVNDLLSLYPSQVLDAVGIFSLTHHSTKTLWLTETLSHVQAPLLGRGAFQPEKAFCGHTRLPKTARTAILLTK